MEDIGEIIFCFIATIGFIIIIWTGLRCIIVDSKEECQAVVIEKVTTPKKQVIIRLENNEIASLEPDSDYYKLLKIDEKIIVTKRIYKNGSVDYIVKSIKE